jgi:RimJ/RimL family protein N-acetyltransferase
VRAMIAERLDRVALEQGGDHLSLVVTLQEDPDTPIGTAMLRWVSEEHAQGEVGYVLHPDQQGKGYATELTRTLVDLGFRETELHRIFGRLDARNKASQRVLEKAGMRVEAHLVENEWVKGEWTSEIVCAVLRTEWEQALLSR